MSTLAPVVTTLGLIIGAYTVVCAAMWFAQPYLLYQPQVSGALERSPADVGLAYEPVTLTTRDGIDLAAWYVYGPDADAPVVLFFHGNAGHIGDRLETLEFLHEAGAATLIVDYRGYGASGGQPSERGTYLDARAAWNWLTAERGIDQARVILFGRSLGAAVAAHLASETEPAGLVLEAAFTSVPDLAAELYPWLPARWLTRYRYATADDLEKVSCPIFIAHAANDDIVPYAHARRLRQRRPALTTFYRLEGDHNSAFLVSQPGYTRALERFFAEATAGGVGEPGGG